MKNLRLVAILVLVVVCYIIILVLHIVGSYDNSCAQVDGKVDHLYDDVEVILVLLIIMTLLVVVVIVMSQHF